MQIFLYIAAGGALGAVARYSLSLAINHWVHQVLGWRMAVGTMAVNVLGCLLMGCVFAWLSHKMVLNDNLRLFLSVGFLGAFTTFSTFSLESLEYLQRGELMFAVLNIVLSVSLGLIAVAIGFYALRALLN